MARSIVPTHRPGISMCQFQGPNYRRHYDSSWKIDVAYGVRATDFDNYLSIELLTLVCVLLFWDKKEKKTEIISIIINLDEIFILLRADHEKFMLYSQLSWVNLNLLFLHQSELYIFFKRMMNYLITFKF